MCLRCRWWRWFESCEDALGLCKSSAGAQKFSGADAKTLLKDGNEITFSILRATEAGIIPRNYFCSWTLELEEAAEYQMSIKRNFSPIKEQLELNIIGEKKQQLVQDAELASSSPEIEWERFALVNTKGINIFARNK